MHHRTIHRAVTATALVPAVAAVLIGCTPTAADGSDAPAAPRGRRACRPR